MAANYLLSGELVSDGVSTNVVLDVIGLQWSNKSGDTTVVWSDVIRGHRGKNWKTLCNDDVSAADTFTVHYIQRQANNKWRHKHKTFKTQNTDSWVQLIEEKRTEGKAKRLLVVINPFGGQRRGRQIYQKTVAPLFELADITTEVIVTEDAEHAVRIANTYGFSEVDGLVVVGGDGIYHLLVNTMLIRKQNEGGVDRNDPEVTVLPLDLKIGIIPTGTGNGIHGFLCGVKDVETAALHIIKGKSIEGNILGVYEKTDNSVSLVGYTGIIFGYGILSDLIMKTEQRRWMRTARYPVTMLSTLFSKKRLFDAEIEYLTTDESEKDNEEITQGAAANNWQKLENASYLYLVMFVMRINAEDDNTFFLEMSSDNTTVMLQMKSSALDLIKMGIKSYKQDKELLNLPFLKILHKVVALRFRVIEKNDNDNSTARNEERERERVLDVDGEPYLYTRNNTIEVRFIPRVIQLFATLPANKSSI